MLSKLLRSSLVLLLLPGVGCDDSSDKGAAKADEPAFEPGPMKAVEASQIGLKLEVPENVKLTDGGSEAKLQAEGFPSVTITRKRGEFEVTGTGSSVSGGDVEFTYTIPTSEWRCFAQKVGDHEDLVLKICKSMQPPKNPSVKMDACKTVTAFGADAVNAAWSSKADAFKACFAELEHTGVSFGFNYEVKEDGARNFTKYTSPMVRDAAAKKCASAVYDALKKDPAFNAEGVTAGQIECDASYSLY